MQTGMISNRIHDARSITILKMSWMKISVFALDGKYPFVSMQISFVKTTFILSRFVVNSLKINERRMIDGMKVAFPIIMLS